MANPTQPLLGGQIRPPGPPPRPPAPTPLQVVGGQGFIQGFLQPGTGGTLQGGPAGDTPTCRGWHTGGAGAEGGGEVLLAVLPVGKLRLREAKVMPQ